MAAPAIDLTEILEVLDEAVAASNAAAAERAVFAEVFKPRERMTHRQWAEQRRMLSPEANALAADAGAPVRYTTALTPYHRDILDALSDPRTEIVVGKLPSQDGKTELLNNFVGRGIDVDPGPMLVLVPTAELAQSWSKDRLAPMLRDTPALRGKVRDARARDAENTILHKKFPGGHLTAVGSNSPAGLSARPIRDVLVDEADRCAKSAGTEGDSIRLAFRRATTFRRGKKLLISSPTIKGDSRIDAEYMLGTQEEWWCPCPHCGEFQYLAFGGEKVEWGIKWDDATPRNVWYVCRVNRCRIEEHEKPWMIEHGQFVAQNPKAGPRRRSFTKTAWASNLVSWLKLVEEWIEVQGKVMELQQFINTVNCELWDPTNGKEIKFEGLLTRLGQGYPDTRRPEHGGKLPPDIAVLMASVDTQDDRLEYAVWGFGAGEEAWLVDWELIDGDPATAAPWKQLDQLRYRSYTNTEGVALRPRYVAIDSGGHHTKRVYDYARSRQRQGVFAIKGSSQQGAPLLGKPTRNNSARVLLYPVGSFTGKETLAHRLARVQRPGPGYVHLPAWLDTEQVTQFTRMKLITPTSKGGRKWRKPKREWEETGRVEQFILYVYALIALQRIGPTNIAALGALAKRQNAKAAAKRAAQQSPAMAPIGPANRPGRRPDGGFVGRW